MNARRKHLRWLSLTGAATISLAALSISPAAAQTPPPPAPQAGNGELPPPEAKKTEPGYLGILGDDKHENGLGVRMMQIDGGGPADRGGLKADDLVTQVNGKPVHNTREMQAILELLPAGSKVAIVIDRDGKAERVEITLGTRPAPAQRRFAQFGAVSQSPDDAQDTGDLPPPNGAQAGGTPANGNPPHRSPASELPPPLPAPADSGEGGGPRPVSPAPASRTAEATRPAPVRRPLLGVRTLPVTEDVRVRERLATASGAVVVARTSGSPAAEAGIPVGAIITSFGGTPIDSPQQLTRLVIDAGAGHEVEIVYVAAGQRHEATVKLADFAHHAASAALPAPPQAELPGGPAAMAPTDAEARIDALERRVRELENRVRELEPAQKGN